MNNIVAATTILFMLIGSYTLWVLPAKDWRRIAGPIMLVVVFLAQCAISLTGLGLPVPYWFIKLYRTYEHAEVYTFHLNEPNSIELWVFIDKDLTPTTVMYPWSTKMAKDLIKEFMDREKLGGTIELLGGDMMPYHIKPKALPDKEGNQGS